MFHFFLFVELQIHGADSQISGLLIQTKQK